MLSVVRRSYYHRGEYRENCPGEVSGTTNNKELRDKKRDYLAALRRSTRQPSASIEELCTLAHSGMLNKSERALYDDLSVVLMLLGEGQLESA